MTAPAISSPGATGTVTGSKVASVAQGEPAWAAALAGRMRRDLDGTAVVPTDGERVRVG